MSLQGHSRRQGEARRRQPAEEPAVAKEFGGLNYGVEAIWRKPGRPGAKHPTVHWCVVGKVVSGRWQEEEEAPQAR